ncbi:MAG: hypothetical protein FWH59_01155 [Lentimicrobiaceae bacterium]|nr:hypothetical protein [Lentimicrobiaceae bacterium]
MKFTKFFTILFLFCGIIQFATAQNYTVTFPSATAAPGVNFIRDWSGTVPSGESRDFTVTTSHHANNPYLIKANGDILTPVAGVYTIANITSDQTVTFEMVVPTGTHANEENTWTEDGSGRYDITWYTNNTSATDYEISTAAELAGLAVIVGGLNGVASFAFSGRTITLTSDIDLSAHWWTAIGSNYASTAVVQFAGTFDGNGKNISGMYVNLPTQSRRGFISQITATGRIKNVTILSGYMQVFEWAGAIVGQTALNSIVSDCVNYATFRGNGSSASGQASGIVGVNAGTVERCVNYGFITGISGRSAGIVGNNSGTILYCANYGDVNIIANSNWIGGIAGLVTAGSINYCYNQGNISTTGTTVGGIAGMVNLNTTIKYCYSAGNVTGNTSATKGALIGNTPAAVTVTYDKCYYDNQLCNLKGVMSMDPDPDDVSGKPSVELYGDNLRTDATGDGWTDENWKFNANKYPRLFFEPDDLTNSFAIIFPPVTGITFTPHGGSTSPVEEGGNYSFTVTLDVAYSNAVITIKTNDVLITPVSDVYTITNIMEDQEITVEGLVINTYTISATANPTEGGTITGANTYEHGDNVILTATANTQYRFIDWTLNSIPVGTNPTYNFTATQNAAYIANFELIAAVTYTVEFPSVTGATFTIEQGSYTPVDEGGNFSFRVTLAPEYNKSVIVIKANGIILTPTANVYTITNIQEDQVVTIEGLLINTYTIAANASPSGSATIVGADTYTHGNSVTLTATPVTGYDFINWTLGGTHVTNDLSFTFTATADATYIANLSVQEYTVTFTPVTGITFTPEPGSTSPVPIGGSYSFKVTTNQNYAYNPYIIKANGVVLTPVEEVYTINNITENQTVTFEIAFPSGNHADGENVWTGAADGFYDISWFINNPTATTYEISTAAQLAGLSVIASGLNGVDKNSFQGKTLIQTQDIDLSAHWWTPIGNGASSVFAGTFDGNGKNIYGVYVNLTTTNTGFFSYINANARLKNITIASGYLTASNYLGAIAGQTMVNSIVTNCINYATVNGQGTAGTGGCGGIAGQISGTLEYCKNYGFITGKSDRSAGMTGLITTGGEVTYCANYGNIDISGASFGLTGGIMGLCQSTTPITISYCYNQGTIQTATTQVGGILGSSTNVAGLKYCYSAGNVIGNTSANKGAITGSAGSTIYTEVFYDNQLCALGAVANAGIAGVEGRPTAEMQGNSLRIGDSGDGWSDLHWKFVENQYPICRGQLFTVTLPDGIAGATFTPYGGSVSPVEYGGSFSFTVTIAPEYSNSNIIIKTNGIIITPVSDIYTISDIFANQTVVIEDLMVNTYAVLAQITPTGSGTVTGTGAHQHGNLVTLIANATAGYKFVKWTQNDIEVGTDPSFSFTVIQDTIFTANFEVISTYTITLPTLTGAVVEPEPGYELIVNEGENFAFHVNLEPAYSNSNLTVKANGAILTATDGIYTIINITEDKEVTVEDVIMNKYTITATAGAGGSITPQGEIEVLYGENQDFIFTPNEKWIIIKVLVDGVDVPGAIDDEFYIFTNVTADHTISVEFEEENSVKETTIEQVQVYSYQKSIYIVNERNVLINSVEICDQLGRVIYRNNMVEKPITLQVETGNYFVRIATSDNKVQSTKVFIH